MKKRSMGSHQSSSMISDNWLTPPEIIKSLGIFDLDPCAPESMPWKTANKVFTKRDDGLNKDWYGRVWLNPPYSREAIKWLEKLSIQGNGIALVFARTETEWFFSTIWNRATALLFIKGRIYFHRENGIRANSNAGAPSVLVAYGASNAFELEKCGIEGKFIKL